MKLFALSKVSGKAIRKMSSNVGLTSLNFGRFAFRFDRHRRRPHSISEMMQL